VAGRPKTMAKRVSALEEQAFQLCEDLTDLWPTQYMQKEGSVGKIGALMQEESSLSLRDVAKRVHGLVREYGVEPFGQKLLEWAKSIDEPLTRRNQLQQAWFILPGPKQNEFRRVGLRPKPLHEDGQGGNSPEAPATSSEQGGGKVKETESEPPAGCAWYTQQQLADYCGVNPRTAYNWLNNRTGTLRVHEKKREGQKGTKYLLEVTEVERNKEITTKRKARLQKSE